MMLFRIVLALCLLAPSAVRAEAPKDPAGTPSGALPGIALSVEPQEAAVGEVVHWKVKIKRRPDVQVLLSKAASFGDFEVRDKAISKVAVSTDFVEELLDVQLIAFAPGDVTIAPQQLTVVDKAGQVKELSTGEAKVKIRSLVGNEPEAKLKEDLGPGETVIVKNYLILWILGAILAIGIVASITLLVRWLLARRRARPSDAVLPSLPPDRVALDKLEALRRSSLLEEGEVKEFYVRLSEAVREYVGGRFAFHSLELSSSELLEKLKRTPLPADDYHAMADFLRDTDLVKFARVEPPVQESRALLEKSVRFVERTTLQLSGPVDEIAAEADNLEREVVGKRESIDREIEKLSRDTDPVPARERGPKPLKPPVLPPPARKVEPDTDPRLPPAPPPKPAPKAPPKPAREATARMWHAPEVEGKAAPKPAAGEPEGRDLDTEPAPPRPSRPVPLKKQPAAPKATPRAPQREARDTEPVPPRPSRPVPLKKEQTVRKPASEEDDA